MADPQGLLIAGAAANAVEFVGLPEAQLNLAHAVVYLATAPKSNALYKASKSANKMAGQTGSLMPPMEILNAPTALMDEIGYGKGYVYDHDTPEGFSGQNYFPDELSERPRFYQTTERGFEREIMKRLSYWQKLRERR